MRTPSPLHASRAHAPPASSLHSDANELDTPECIDFSVPRPGEPSYADCSHVCRTLELGAYRTIEPPQPKLHHAYVPPSVALMMLEPDRAAAVVPTAASAEPLQSRNHRQTACLVFLGLLAGAAVGSGIYFGAIRPHQD